MKSINPQIHKAEQNKNSTNIEKDQTWAHDSKKLNTKSKEIF